MKRFFKSPAFVILIMLVILNIVEGRFDNPMDWLMSELLMLPGIIIGLSFHEFAHGAMSYALGDPTPKLQGRLTINPASHIDPFGFIALLLAGFGWGVPVQIDPRYYKHRRRDEFLVSIAGVAMNFLVAIVFSLIIKVIFIIQPTWLIGEVGNIVLDIFHYIILINLVLMIFNLLPVPPLDGFGIVTQIFNLEKYSWYYKVYDKGFLILLLLIFLNITDYVLTPGVNFVYSWLVNTIIF
ncbi:site-2 protease family protein [Emergencia sp.]|uniref:site-2 protease family protein n=1 Tax=Emergencia sp. TaxID=1926557 RepID=UPI003AEF1F97